MVYDSIKMDIVQEWTENELYSELIAMPLWTICAFQNLKGAEILPSTDIRHQLIKYLVTKHLQRCPHNTDHKDNWKVFQYYVCVRAAVFECKKIIEM